MYALTSACLMPQLLLGTETRGQPAGSIARIEEQALRRADRWGKTGLHYAGFSRNRALARTMIDFYLDRAPGLLLQRDDMGNTALHTAAAYGTLETVELLIKHAKRLVSKLTPKVSTTTALHPRTEGQQCLSA